MANKSLYYVEACEESFPHTPRVERTEDIMTYLLCAECARRVAEIATQMGMFVAIYRVLIGGQDGTVRLVPVGKRALR